MSQAPQDHAAAPAPPGGALLRGLDAASRRLNQAMAWFGGIGLVAMMLFTVGDVVLRSIGRPVAGSFEIIGWLSAAAMALSLGYVQLYKGHVAVTLVSDHVRGRTGALLEFVTGVASLAMFVAVSWYVGRYAVTLHETGSLSETLKVVVYPWVYLVGIGFAGLSVALLVDVLRSLARLLAPAR